MSDFDFPRGWKRKKMSNSNFPRGWKRRKWVILAFVGRRRAVFAVFFVSSADDGQFFPFSVLRPWPKHNFSRFLLVGHGRNTIFPIFYSSATAESLLFAFSTRRPRPKRRFHPIPDKKMRFFGSQQFSLKYKTLGGRRPESGDDPLLGF